MAESESKRAPLDPDLLEILRCPVAIQQGAGDEAARLRLVRESWLVCDASGMKYPIVDGVPVMLVEEGERWRETPEDALPVPPPR